MSSPLPRFAVLGLVVFGVCGCSRDATPSVPSAAEPVVLPPLARQSTPDPRLTVDTPFRNVRPDVGYVGDAACATCHPALTASYHQHPMGRSAAVPKSGEGPEKYGAAARLPVEVPGYRLDVARGADRVEHVVAATAPAAAFLPVYRATADVAIGSGTRGRSYLTCQDGAVWQSPLSWYAEGNRWDVSPGFDLAISARRAVEPGCLFCHVNRVEPVPRAVNRFVEPLLREQAAVGCERCHGPGQLHASERADGVMPNGPDLTIVNPKHLSSELRQDICRQCHLLGEARFTADGRGTFDFRPGLPLNDFIRVFVRHPAIADVGKSVGQFEQVETSTCHTGSGGRLVCTSCHDPHLSPEPAAKPTFYRAKCQTCHKPPGGNDCVAPLAERTAAADNCVFCHMPRGDSTNIVHATVTDHRIRRRPAAPPDSSTHRLPDGATVIVPFRPGRHSDADRDLGIGLAWALGKQSDPTLRQLANRQAFDRLTAVTERRPADDAVWLALVSLNHSSGRAAARLAAARAAARVEPQSEASLAALATATTLADRPTEAMGTIERLIALNPTAADYRVDLVKAAVLAADWPRAEAAARQALAVYPLDPQVRLFLAAALAKLGRGTEASREMAAALALHTDPRMRADAERWLAGQLR